jgi:hypothetical protein
MGPKEARREHANRAAMDLLQFAVRMRDCRDVFDAYGPRHKPPLLLRISYEEALYGAGHQVDAER